MSNWKIGDKAVCLAKEPNWGPDNSPKRYDGPIYNQVVEVDDIRELDVLYLGFIGYRNLYDAKEFRKLSEISAEMSKEILEKALTSIPELV